VLFSLNIIVVLIELLVEVTLVVLTYHVRVVIVLRSFFNVFSCFVCCCALCTKVSLL
jgi:hypothetical protein